MKKSLLINVFIICSFTVLVWMFTQIPTVSTDTNTAEIDGALFEMLYEPIGDGSRFRATIFTKVKPASLNTIEMDLQISSAVTLQNNDVTDCRLLHPTVVCNPNVPDEQWFDVRWNWVELSENTTENMSFIQLDFTCATTGEIRPFSRVDAKMLIRQKSDQPYPVFEESVQSVGVFAYDCPKVGVHPAVSAEVIRGSAYGQIFYDANQDGRYYAPHGDTPLAGVTVYSIDTGESAITNSNGGYRFFRLYQGNYTFVLDASTIPTDYQDSLLRFGEKTTQIRSDSRANLVDFGLHSSTLPPIRILYLPTVSR